MSKKRKKMSRSQNYDRRHPAVTYHSGNRGDEVTSGLTPEEKAEIEEGRVQRREAVKRTRAEKRKAAQIARTQQEIAAQNRRRIIAENNPPLSSNKGLAGRRALPASTTTTVTRHYWGRTRPDEVRDIAREMFGSSYYRWGTTKAANIQRDKEIAEAEAELKKAEAELAQARQQQLQPPT